MVPLPVTRQVTHCGYTRERVSGRTPMWFLWASGSGVRVNIGRSARMPILNQNDEYADAGGSQHEVSTRCKAIQPRCLVPFRACPSLTITLMMT